MHLVGFTIETYYNARPCARQICISHVVVENTAHLYAWCIIFILIENVRNRYCLKNRTQTVEFKLSNVKVNHVDEYQLQGSN